MPRAPFHLFSKLCAAIPAILLLVILCGGAFTASPKKQESKTVYLPMVAAPPRAGVEALQPGTVTFYDANGEGTCMFDASPADLMVAAINIEEYNTAALCGAYVQIEGPKGSVTVRIVDQCPGCKAGHLDLSEEAFARIAEPADGRIPVRWRVVSPALSGPIQYYFLEGSDPWWTAVQIRNHRNPIVRLEIQRPNGQWTDLPRTTYNYFIKNDPGLGSGPYTFRVTDRYGQVLIDRGIPHRENTPIDGQAQFPPPPAR